MQNLLIEQRGPQGLLKTWRLRSDQVRVSFGHSKHADLRSPLDSVKGIQGLFEFKNGKWYYINLDLHSDVQEFKDGQSEIALTEAFELRMGVSQLSITPFDSRSQLFSSLDTKSDLKNEVSGKLAYQLFTVHQGVKLLETRVIPVSENFVAHSDLSKTKLTPVKSASWVKTPVGALEISQRTIYLDSAEAMMHLTKSQLMDEGGEKTMYATLAGIALLVFMILMAPKAEKPLDSIPTREMREMSFTTPPKKRKMAGEQAPKVQTPPVEQKAAAPAQAAAPNDSSSGTSKTVSAIKSLASGRITQLIGKVSATAARSANVVVTTGIAAGTGASGRALAAVGKISQSGKDWSSEGSGTGIKISTNGVAGGKGVGNVGTLTTGKTGSGGVGLLEDEGEITGGLDREVIAQYIKSKLGEILYCYERQLSANPDLYGKVAVRFSIGGGGEVETQRIGETTLKNATVEGCILQRVAKWKFPQPDGGTKVLVTYPFLFKSTN